MLTARKVRFWYRVHKWTSLICTAFLLMSCLTGLPLIFSDEIDSVLVHRVPTAEVPVGTPLASVDAMVLASRKMFPTLKPLMISWDDDAPRIFVVMAPSFHATLHEKKDLAFDQHTGKLLEQVRPGKGLISFLLHLHREIFLGIPGELFLGVMAILFVIALISGALVYGPFMRRVPFGTIRKRRSTRLKWFDLHNLLGIVTLGWAFVVGMTGAINTISGPLFNVWLARTMPGFLSSYSGRFSPQKLASIDAAIQVTHAALPNMDITSIDFPNAVFGSPEHYLVWTQGKTPLTSRLSKPVLIEAGSGRFIAAENLPWYLRLLEMSRPLHFGDYGGIPLKIIWALFDVALIAVLLSGVYLWLSRRRTPVEDELNRLVKLEESNLDEIPPGLLTR